MKQARGFNRLLVIGFLFLWLVQGSTLLLTNADEQLRRFTRAYEFDFSIWMLDAHCGSSLRRQRWMRPTI